MFSIYAKVIVAITLLYWNYDMFCVIVEGRVLKIIDPVQ